MYWQESGPGGIGCCVSGHSGLVLWSRAMTGFGSVFGSATRLAPAVPMHGAVQPSATFMLVLLLSFLFPNVRSRNDST